MPSSLTCGDPTARFCPSALVTSSLANSFSIGASNLILTSDGAAASFWPAAGLSSSGNECAAATIALLTTIATSAEPSTNIFRTFMWFSFSVQLPVALRKYRIPKNIQEPEDRCMITGYARLVERELGADAEFEPVADVCDSGRHQDRRESLTRRPCD